MDKSNVSQLSGTGFLGLLTILFIGLKLTGVISWSWWLVLLPLYGGIALAVVLLIIFAMILAATGKLK